MSPLMTRAPGSPATAEPARPGAFRLLDVPITNTSTEEMLAWLTVRARATTPTLVAFANAHNLNLAATHPAFHSVLTGATRVLADGTGVRWSARLKGVQVRENLNGTDLFPPLCAILARRGLPLFLLGARPGVARATAERMRTRFPGLRIAGVADGYFGPVEEPALIARINASGAAFLLVAMGSPTQELWLARHHEALRVPVRMAVGGLFDFHSGRIPRAPRWLRQAGMEWIWRLAQEPVRMWRRYLLGNPAFLLRAWRDARRARQGGGECARLARHLARRQPPSLRRIAPGLRRAAWNATLCGAGLAKRALDVLGAGALLVLLAPMLMAIAALIRLDSPGPVLFRQTRVGRWGSLFTLWKFRSMHVDAEQRLAELVACNEMAGGVLFKMRDDPRITRVGRFIRRASIDELPQLWNVLVGDMSLVGPRPPLPREVSEYQLADRRRLDVVPGITCLWQVSGRSELPFPQQVRLDVEYIESQSLSRDLYILLRTIPAVLSGRGAC